MDNLSGSKIYIKIRGISIKFDISLDNTLEQLKEKIKGIIQMDNESYILFFKGNRLYTNSERLYNYGIKNNDVIYLIEKENEEILSILSVFGDKIDIDILNNIQNTREIKQLISEKFFIPINRVQIFFGEVEIIEDQKIKGLSKNGSFLFSWNKYPKAENYVNIEVIDCVRNEIFNLNVDLYGYIYEEIKKNICYDLFYLKYKDRYNNEIFLGPSKNNNSYNESMLKIFSDYHSGEKIIIELHKVEDEYNGFQIFVKLLDGRTITVRCESYEKIRDLKLKLLALENIPLENNLIFAGKLLEDNRTIADYNIQVESTINVVLRLRGG